MKLHHFLKTFITCQVGVHDSGIVVNGLSNLVSGVDAEARQIVEAKYVDEWNSVGWVHRRKLQRVMDSEIKDLVVTSMAKVSSQAVF